MKRITNPKTLWDVLGKAYDTVYRLQGIENILGDEYSLEYLKWLVEAEREGRCVVLPCKDWFEIVFGEQEVFYGIDDAYGEEKIREITVGTAIFSGTDENGFYWEFALNEIGKEIFLTREEAEAALEKMKEGEK